jgi:hypothetical protein
LDQYIIESIKEAQDQATQWLWTYNNDRPNMGIGSITRTGDETENGRVSSTDAPRQKWGEYRISICLWRAATRRNRPEATADYLRRASCTNAQSTQDYLSH